MLSIKRLVAGLAEPYLLSRNLPVPLQSSLNPSYFPASCLHCSSPYACRHTYFYAASRYSFSCHVYSSSSSSIQKNMIGHSYRFNRRNIVAQSFRTPYIIPSMPPMPPPGIFSFSGMSATSASVTRTMTAMLEAFSRALRTTLVGSMMPFFIMSPKSSASAS